MVAGHNRWVWERDEPLCQRRKFLLNFMSLNSGGVTQQEDSDGHAILSFNLHLFYLTMVMRCSILFAERLVTKHCMYVCW